MEEDQRERKRENMLIKKSYRNRKQAKSEFNILTKVMNLMYHVITEKITGYMFSDVLFEP